MWSVAKHMTTCGRYCRALEFRFEAIAICIDEAPETSAAQKKRGAQGTRCVKPTKRAETVERGMSRLIERHVIARASAPT